MVNQIMQIGKWFLEFQHKKQGLHQVILIDDLQLRFKFKFKFNFETMITSFFALLSTNEKHCVVSFKNVCFTPDICLVHHNSPESYMISTESIHYRIREHTYALNRHAVLTNVIITFQAENLSYNIMGIGLPVNIDLSQKFYQ